MSILGTLVIITILAGVFGTGLGGVLGVFIRKDSKKAMSLLLSFAGGVMLSVVCFDLIRDAVETKVGIFIIIGAILGGCAVAYLLDYLIDGKESSEQSKGQTSLFVAGIVMASAVAVHNVPVGMTLGASYASDNGVLGSSAIMLAILISMHNIPEGMSIAAPLISGGMSRIKAVLITAASGVPTIIGAVLGYELGGIGAMGLALSLAFASGAMLYVVFGEILPQAVQMYKGKLPTFFTIIGMMVGLLVIYL